MEAMTSKGASQAPPRTAGIVPRRPMLCQCSSASTSFMLAALRVLHVDTSHAPAGIAWIEEQPSPSPAPPANQRFRPPNPQSNRTKKMRKAAARGATCVCTMSSNGIHTPEVHARFSRPAEALLPNSPSCGNQPANISLTAPSRTDTHATSST
jgi:hypothetical protein